MTLLQVKDLVTGYGSRQVINGLTLDVGVHEIVAIVGHNGSGKSTLLKAIFGLRPIWTGELRFGGKTIGFPTPISLLNLGVSYVPQGNRVFPNLTVQENLELAGVSLNDRETLSRRIQSVLKLFPQISFRLAQRSGTLSGGEKQALALASGLIISPRLLLLDEPSLGLAPQLVKNVLGHIRSISGDGGVSVLIVEQKVREVLEIADRVYVLRNGSVSFSGPASQLDQEEMLRDVYL